MDRSEFLRYAGLATVAAVTPPGLVALNPEAAEASRSADRIIRVGKRYLGTPYRKMDCSEFTRKTYGKAVGVWMPSAWWAQDAYGYEPASKKRGDLLCFKGHVAIYYGRGQVLHSSSYFHKVCISSLGALVDDIGGYKVRRIR